MPSKTRRRRKATYLRRLRAWRSKRRRAKKESNAIARALAKGKGTYNRDGSLIIKIGDKSHTIPAARVAAEREKARAKTQMVGGRRTVIRNPLSSTVSSTKSAKSDNPDVVEAPSLAQRLLDVILFTEGGMPRFAKSGTRCGLCGDLVAQGEIISHMGTHDVDLKPRKERAARPHPDKTSPARRPPARPQPSRWKQEVSKMAGPGPSKGAALRHAKADQILECFSFWARLLPENFYEEVVDAANMAEMWRGISDSYRRRERDVLQNGFAPACAAPFGNAARMASQIADEHMEVVAQIQRRYSAYLESKVNMDYFVNRR